MAIGTQTLVTGTRTTTLTGTTNLKVRDVEDKITKLDPYLTPIEDFFFTNPLQNELTTGDRGKSEWYEDAFLPDTTTLGAGGITGGSNTEAGVKVTNDYFIAYDTVLIESTGEVCGVTAVTPASDTIDIALNGTGNITASTAGENIQRIVPAWIEKGSKAPALTVLPVQKWAYPQIIKKGLSMTGRQQASKQYGGADWGYQWVKAGQEIREALERMFLYNTAAYDDTTGAVGKTFSAGLGSLTTNDMSYSGSCDKAELNAAIKQVATAGKSAHLVLMAGGQLLEDLAAFIHELYAIRQTTGSFNLEKFGMASAVGPRKPFYVTYQHSQCIVDITWNPQLKGDNFDTMGYFISPKNLKKIYVGPDKKGPRKYRAELGIETPGDDSYDAQLLFDQGLKIKLEESHGKFNKS